MPAPGLFPSARKFTENYVRRLEKGVDKQENRETKRAYSFPFGDFAKVHRSGVISAESRAGQYDHDEIRDALRGLLELIDGEKG